MENASNHLQLLQELEAKHEQLSQLLDELDQRVSAVLAEYQPKRAGAGLESPAEPALPVSSETTPLSESPCDRPARAA
jgi:hypothetical protein